MSNKHRKLWEERFGPIPRDANGRSFEIHHTDGNRKNNQLENLRLLTIEEHLEVHMKQGDWGACALIMKRMNLPVNYMSDIQRGKKRPGIGGAPKGRVPWNKDIKGYKLKCNRKGKRFSSKLNIEDVKRIRQMYREQKFFDNYIEYTYQKRKGGQCQSYEWFLSKRLVEEEFVNLSSNGIYKVIVKKSWQDVTD